MVPEALEEAPGVVREDEPAALLLAGKPEVGPEEEDPLGWAWTLFAPVFWGWVEEKRDAAFPCHAVLPLAPTVVQGEGLVAPDVDPESEAEALANAEVEPEVCWPRGGERAVGEVALPPGGLVCGQMDEEDGAGVGRDAATEGSSSGNGLSPDVRLSIFPSIPFNNDAPSP